MEVTAHEVEHVLSSDADRSGADWILLIAGGSAVIFAIFLLALVVLFFRSRD